MNSLLGYFIEANLYLVCFYLLYQILLVRDKHFRFNRAFLLGGIFLSLVLPALSFHITPEPSNAFEGYIILPVITITSVQTESIGFLVKWWHIIGMIYLSGVAFYLLRLFWQMAQILRRLPILNSSREKRDGYTLVTTRGEIPTCSFFKYLFWDKSANLNQEEQKQIFEHELTHIRQLHSVDVLLVEVLRAFFWFNPVIHLLKSRIAEVHEYLADHQVTKQIGVEHYSKLLTLQIFNNFDFALSNNFHKSQVVKRIKMLKSTHSRSIWLNVALLIPVLALLISVLSCDVTEDILPQSEPIDTGLELPEGWILAGETTLSEEVQTKLNSVKDKLSETQFMVVKSTHPDGDEELLRQSITANNWNVSSYDDDSENDIALIVKSDQELEIEPVVASEEIIPVEGISSTEIFTIVEDQPAPYSGMGEFYQYVQANLKYPAQARRMGIEGKVFVQFVVAKDGSLTDVKAVKGIGAGCDAEAVRVISSSPKWKPGIQRNRAVNVRMILPITFKLG
jgi:TonB family protein